jgi:hypothetical protein
MGTRRSSRLLPRKLAITRSRRETLHCKKTPEFATRVLHCVVIRRPGDVPQRLRTKNQPSARSLLAMIRHSLRLVPSECFELTFQAAGSRHRPTKTRHLRTRGGSRLMASPCWPESGWAVDTDWLGASLARAPRIRHHFLLGYYGVRVYT